MVATENEDYFRSLNNLSTGWWQKNDIPTSSSPATLIRIQRRCGAGRGLPIPNFIFNALANACVRTRSYSWTWTSTTQETEENYNPVLTSTSPNPSPVSSLINHGTLWFLFGRRSCSESKINCGIVRLSGMGGKGSPWGRNSMVFVVG